MKKSTFSPAKIAEFQESSKKEAEAKARITVFEKKI